MPDTKRMISEVAAENGIRIEPGDDPERARALVEDALRP